MYNLERKAAILKYLESNGQVYVNQLAETLSASKETIRKDLHSLEKEGMLKRTHGGAVCVSPSEPVFATANNWSFMSNEIEEPINVRQIKTFAEKNQICKKAASYIENQDTIFVDNSSTTLFLAKYIPVHLQVTIITNSIKFILETASLNNPNLQIICLSGFFNANNLSLYGSRTTKSANDFYPNKAFLSCAGINAVSKLTDTSLNEVDTKQAFIEKSEKVFLLADHNKFSSTGPYHLVNFQCIDYLITDSKSTITSVREIIDNPNTNIQICDEMQRRL